MGDHRSYTMQPQLIPFLLIILSSLHLSTAEYAIGVNYGTVADNLPPPSSVSAFLVSQTTITKVKIFDANPTVIKAFAYTNISLTITVPNNVVPSLANASTAKSWLANNILPYHPATKIHRIVVGNEILATGDKALISHLLPAMESIHSALRYFHLDDQIQISTPHSLGILSISDPPSSGRFRRVFDKSIVTPILEFHRRTKTPFMICPYPYFGYDLETLDFALFKPNGGVLDKSTGLNYTNMFDAQMDAVYSAMTRVGYGDVELVVAETGWPSASDPEQVGVSVGDAASYNGNLVKYVGSGVGTPLMPNRSFEVYVFSLFNEDLKSGVDEQNFGLFRSDFKPVYDVGIMRDPQSHGPSPEAPSPTKWCIPKEEVSDEALQANIDFVCGIQDGGSCYKPDNTRAHASYVMNAYYQANGHHECDCDFYNTGITTTSSPSYEECAYGA